MSDARHYLLGSATEAQRTAIEEQYFAADDIRLAIDAEEERLIEAYLAGELSDAERRQFEAHYLASPAHRRRVEVVRALVRPVSSRAVPYSWLAAAAVLVLAIGGVWLFGTRQSPTAPPATVSTQPPPPIVPPSAPPAVFAFALSPINVRSDQPSRTLVIPPATDVVLLELQQEGPFPPLSDPTVTIRTVEGRDVWQGSGTIAGLRSGVLARVEVPAATLPPDDYFIAIGGYRYFLRVSATR